MKIEKKKRTNIQIYRRVVETFKLCKEKMRHSNLWKCGETFRLIEEYGKVQTYGSSGREERRQFVCCQYS